MKKKTLYIKKHRYKKQSIDDLKSGKLKTWWTKKYEISTIIIQGALWKRGRCK